MNPTPKLRFVERHVLVPYELQKNAPQTKIVRILQQWWEKDIASRYTAAIAGDPSGEWRDVPIEKECKARQKNCAWHGQTTEKGEQTMDKTLKDTTPIDPTWMAKTGGFARDMTLRDEFAARAMPGLMVRNWSHHKGTDEELIVIWAQSAYGVADAMLAAREAK